MKFSVNTVLLSATNVIVPTAAHILFFKKQARIFFSAIPFPQNDDDSHAYNPLLKLTDTAAAVADSVFNHAVQFTHTIKNPGFYWLLLNQLPT